MSISSVLNPSVWASQIASKSPLAAAAAQGIASFGSALMQALQQASSASAPTGASGLSTAQATTAPAGASGVHGHRHGHHGGGGN